MEREVFSLEEAARVLNRDFVCVKVDREERPDIDALYMECCTALTGSGGWPLSVFLTPEKAPFFAGTYFPLDSFLSIAGQINRLWHQDRDRLLTASRETIECIRRRPAVAADTERLYGLPQNAYNTLVKRYDKHHGGFGTAPKFPSPHTLMFLQRYGRLHPETEACQMARHTLERMALGGLFDHVGGGFFRYSTDSAFRIPHFEKMLYDNAMLALVYAEFGMEDVSRRVLTFCFRELAAPDGTFYTSLDADSDGHEGRYYLQTPDSVHSVLGAAAARYRALYDITSDGNFEGASHLNLLKNGPLSVEDSLFAAGCHARLLAARTSRVPPARDEKILLGGNSLMLAALATCGRLMRQPAYIDAAVTLAEALRSGMRRQDRWYAVRTAAQGLGPHPAAADDYAYFAWGLYRLHQATLNPFWLTLCQEVCEEMLALFYDEEDGLLWLSGADVTDIPLRAKQTQDGALPSGNAIAAGTLLRLYILTGIERFQKTADHILTALGTEATAYPAAYTAAMSAVLLSRHAIKAEIPPGSSPYKPEVSAFHPFAAFQENPHISTPLVCAEGSCSPPLTNPALLAQHLEPEPDTDR